MRVKDKIKQEAVFNATIKLVNEIGFAASSVAKIAREAGVSPATIYIYYDNKEDLLISTYMMIKEEMAKAWLENLDDRKPIRDIFYDLWIRMFEFAQKHPDYFMFAEQFANSPLIERVDKEKMDRLFEPLYKIIRRGIEQKIIKDVKLEILGAFLFYPVYTLANKRICHDFGNNEKDVETAFTMAWDAIKL